MNAAKSDMTDMRPTSDDALLYYSWMGHASRAWLPDYFYTHTARPNNSVIFSWLMGDLYCLYLLTGWIPLTCISH